ncbi:MAG: phosphatidate cytidylyltransferase [Acidimicrobiales bacterium]
MNDRPTHPDDDEQEGFRLLGAMDPSDESDRPVEPDQGADPGASEEDTPRPFRARDLLGEPEEGSEFGGASRDEGEPDRGAEPVGEGSGSHSLPHWTDPPTGEVPRIFSDGDDDLAPWARVSTSQPRWQDPSSGWDDADLSVLGDEPPRMGMRDDRAASDDFFTFDDAKAPPDPLSVPRDPSDPYGDRSADPFAAERAQGPATGRNMGLASVVGAALAAGALALISVGPAAAMVLVVVVLVLASAELMSTLRRVGYSPPALIALAAAVTMPLAAYWRGETGLLLGAVLTVLVALLWYVLDIGDDHAVPNVGVTTLTVAYVAGFGSFAALLLRLPHGTGLLLAAVLGPIAYDIVGLLVGRSMGRSPLSAISPNKTIEGTVGGMAAAFLVTWIGVGGVIGGGITPFSSPGDAIVLGVALALISPLGDLCESMIKRDLGVKDMGTVLPGHGGVLDRFDAILVSLPATYYVAHLVF